MKYITFILALIVVAASIAPCLDVEAASLSDIKTELISSDTNQHQAVGDICSPFCTCSCCVTSADVFSCVYKLHTIAKIPMDMPVFNQNMMKNSGISFWQPPKV
ncbi:DUF6660 family protein [Daejeonella sp. JGW-45]|uniref:DUF6660 family protein n=1 Tax=Daejeonella sp. JGW-45 TaxID=3034148 RepID=UPI0023EBE30A|nr:DUF6660 family protein [Daejeonella sp. JGW-45]